MNQPMLFASTFSAETIRDKAAEVVSRPEYQLDRGLSERSQSFFLTILYWFLMPFFWLFEAMDGLPVAVRILVIIVLTLVALALMAHIIWSLVVAIRPTRSSGGLSARRDREIDPAEWEAAAQSAEDRGEYLEAVRHLFRAALIHIERAEDRKLRIGITNRELLRRYGKSPLGVPLGFFVETIDRKWYGKELCEVADFEQCRQGYLHIRDVTRRGADALRA